MSGRRASGTGLVAGVRRVRGLLPPDGLLYHDAHYLAATVEVDPAAMRRWLPAGLRLTSPARADVITAWFPQTSFGSRYHEAGLFVHVRTWRGTGIHCPWMILDDDVALILGREVLGYPKKLGEIDWRFDGTGRDAPFAVRASRRGAALVSMTGTVGEVLDDAPPILGRPHRNVVGTLGLALPRVVGFTPGEHVREVRRVDLDLEIGGSDRDPLHLMGLGDVVDARLHRVDLSAGRPPVPLRPLTPLHALSTLRPRVL